MERAAMCAHCPVALEVLGEVSEVSAMRKIGQLQGQHTCRPYTASLYVLIVAPSSSWFCILAWTKSIA